MITNLRKAMRSDALVAAITAFIVTFAIQLLYQRQITLAFVWRGLFAAALVLLFYWVRALIVQRRPPAKKSR